MLFDFDGPICHLFASRSAPRVARRIRRELRSHDRLPQGMLRETNAHLILRAARTHERAGPVSAPVRAVERLLTHEEERAAGSAAATEGARDLIALLARLGVRQAITSNNADRAILRYLEREHLDGYFFDLVFGRRPDDPVLMKPDPDCVHRALRGLGVAEQERRHCLLIGDSPADGEAAREAGVPFVGFIPLRHRSAAGQRCRELRAVGAEYVVLGMQALIDAFTVERTFPSSYERTTEAPPEGAARVCPE